MIPVSYDYEGAAAATGMAVSKIRARVREGRIAVKYDGKDVLIEHDELKAYVSALPSERRTAD